MPENGLFDAWRKQFEQRQKNQGGVFDPKTPGQLGTLFQQVAPQAPAGSTGPADLQTRIAGLLSNPILQQMMGGQGQPMLQGGGVHQWSPPAGMLYQLPQVSPLLGLLGRLG